MVAKTMPGKVRAESDDLAKAFALTEAYVEAMSHLAIDTADGRDLDSEIINYARQAYVALDAERSSRSFRRLAHIV